MEMLRWTSTRFRSARIPQKKSMWSSKSACVPIRSNMNSTRTQAPSSSIAFSIRRCSIPATTVSFPHTLAADGDPVDVMVIGRMPVQPGAVLAVRPIGVLELEDEAGGDEKILAVPTRNITQLYDRVKSWTDVPEIDLRRIQHFFEHYKDLEPEKWTPRRQLARCRHRPWSDQRGDPALGVLGVATLSATRRLS